MSTFVSLLTAAASAISGWFGWKNSKVSQRREIENDIEKKEKEKQDLKDEISAAVYNGDDAKLNEILTRLMPIISLVYALAILAGCMAPKTVVRYVPADRRIESCTNSIGIACKAVPDAVFMELLEAQIELNALRTEMKVDKQLSK